MGSALADYGLHHDWRTSQTPNGGVTVTCVLTHRDGHSEQTSLSAPADDSGNKNGIQQIGSTINYLQRYTLMAITGLAAQDTDDDGTASTSRPMTHIDQRSGMGPDYGLCEWHDERHGARTGRGTPFPSLSLVACSVTGGGFSTRPGPSNTSGKSSRMPPKSRKSRRRARPRGDQPGFGDPGNCRPSLASTAVRPPWEMRCSANLVWPKRRGSSNRR